MAKNKSQARTTLSAEPGGGGAITIITSNAEFASTIRQMLETLIRIKPEFDSVEVREILPGPNATRSIAASLSDTLLYLCDVDELYGLVGALNKTVETTPVFVLVTKHSGKSISTLAQTSYLYSRGLFRSTSVDPEDLGVIARELKDEMRKALALRDGNRIFTKKLGWKIDMSAEDTGWRQFVSLFADPVMREFMQQIVYGMQAVKTEMPKRPFGSGTDIMRLFQSLRDAKAPRNQEASAKELLSCELSAAFRKPQPILLEGETGCGKTVVAEWIHRRLTGSGSDSPFIRISAVNLGKDLLEIELFGTLRGAFTDAEPNPGKLLLGWGGVVFLDEIGDLPAEMQARLLVYLDELKFTPGAWPFSWSIFSPVYIVAATNKNLRDAVANGEFRRDLYYRFPLRLRVPSLRERRSDMRPLIDMTLQDRAINPGAWVEEITLDAIRKLESHTFPGNFRELETVLSRAAFHAKQSRRRTIMEQDVEF